MIVIFKDCSRLECERIDFIQDEICVDNQAIYNIDRVKAITKERPKVHSDYADGHPRNW